MSNYTKITNYTSKDALPTGNPSKVVKGTEIDNEFTAVASAVATKADTAAPAFTGVPTAPTATAGTSTTQLATTAFVTVAAQALYPVGSIYINAAVATNPATLLGFGTWTAFGTGRVLVGLDQTNGAFFDLGQTGGSTDASVVSHTHTYSGTTGTQSADHAHGPRNGDGNFIMGNAGPNSGFASGASYTNTAGTNETGGTTANHSHNFSGTTAATGSSATNANLQPYIVVYMWKRTV